MKDERHLDRFDQVFGHVFKGLELLPDALEAEIPEEWLRLVSELYLSEEEKKRIEELGGWEKIMEELKKRLAEQQGRHAGGNKWIGTGGTSPFGAYGYNPAGMRIGQEESRHRRAIKVWDKREFRDLDDDGRDRHAQHQGGAAPLRPFARQGAAEELDLDGTIRGTAHKGYLDIRMRPERRNAVKVLMFFDVGGSMDWHVQGRRGAVLGGAHGVQAPRVLLLPQLPLRARVARQRAPAEASGPDLGRAAYLSRRLQGDLRRRCGDEPVRDHARGRRGRAHERGAWRAVAAARDRRSTSIAVWLNPLPEAHWGWTPSIGMVRGLMEGRMYPLTLEGLDAAMRELMR